ISLAPTPAASEISFIAVANAAASAKHKTRPNSAAYHVGYDDASHFNREYKRLFGAPPMRDVERLREAVRG
ncbi:MAG: hypothetical protein V7L19_17420, partial [Nostoc sp.]